MSVGVGVGLIFLAREGLSFATLRRLPPPTELQARGRTRTRPRRSVLALACPASLKGVLSATAAAAALGEGLRAGGARRGELPVADGGEGTAEALHAALGGDWREADVHDAFGRPRRARWLAAPGRDGGRRVRRGASRSTRSGSTRSRASSRGSASSSPPRSRTARRRSSSAWAARRRWTAARACSRSSRELPVPARVACDVRATLAEAPRLFGPQKGAWPAEVAELERRLAGPLRPRPAEAAPPAASARRSPRSARARPGAPLVLDAIGFDAARVDLVVTGEGRVDATTALGKAPGEVARRCAGGRRPLRRLRRGRRRAAAWGRDGRALGRPGARRGRPARAGRVRCLVTAADQEQARSMVEEARARAAATGSALRPVSRRLGSWVESSGTGRG